MAETNTLMPTLLADFRAHCSTVETRSFADKSGLESLGEPLIVNCTGIGAKALFGDPERTPFKGQITLIRPQPSVTYAYPDPVLDLYMFPRSDGMVLGGSHILDNWSTDADRQG